MKLNKKVTILIGFAFLSITAFWQMYDNLIPLILTDTFKIDETITGVIMAADNVLALFLLPFFGSLSDRCNSKMGKRKPFILFGTVAVVCLMTFIPILDNSYFAEPSKFKAITFIVLLGLILVAMGTYRSPAVALMPDVTPKPLRSKGNAVINLMGAIGGILYLVATTILYPESKTEGLEHINYLPIFAVVGFIMIASLLVVMTYVNEPRLRAKQEEYEKAHPEQDLTVADEKAKDLAVAKRKMPKAVKISLFFLLLSVALWYVGYNAISTWFTTYAEKVWGMSIGTSSRCLTIAMIGAIATYIPAGLIAGKIGRKTTILFSAALLAACFGAAYVYTRFSNSFHWGLYVLYGGANYYACSCRIFAE